MPLVRKPEPFSLSPGEFTNQCILDSIYQYLEAKINEAWVSLEGATVDPNVYAKTVVAKVTKSNPPQEIWCGGGAFAVWAVERLGIRWIYTLAFSKMFGLDKMAPSSE